MTQYVGIRSEGGLIPTDILDQIAQEKLPGQQAKDFGLPATKRLTDEIARAWSDAQDYWHIFSRRIASLPENETGTTITREKWAVPLLTDLLGHELSYQPSAQVVAGKNYPISHRAGAGEESPPVDIQGFNVDLDRRPEGRRQSPQALVQEYLNNSEEHLWGVTTNGRCLRLLRDTSRTSRPSYLEFDLADIVENNRFNEWALFYRVCHRTRLPRTAEDSTSCWLEKYFQTSIEQGGRVRDRLRDGVEGALKLLGTGLLRHPQNHLRVAAKSGQLTATEFHRQLLRLIYRLLFLMVAEERRMILPEAPDSERRRQLYDRYYSIARLRALAEKPIEPSTFGDLWIGLQRTFALFEDGDSNPLGIPPLNGDLFGPLAVRDLRDTRLYNDDLIVAMRHLSLFREDGAQQRINYAALDVEELGSVYESLLDFQPVFEQRDGEWLFDLRTGSERKSTGSYYTRPELVRELIESALVPVMEERLAKAKDKDIRAEQKKKIEAILSMTVCDPACGSGHFLLAAARRLGRELAKIRTCEDEPTPQAFHVAVRDVITHCIYGVDLNPLAVDLCKLALWLEGHWTGKPLSFLDHHIKCGNSLIGVLDPKVLEDGIPDEAFTPVTGDDKEVAKAFKKRNREERKGQYSLTFEATEHVHQYATTTHGLDEIAEETPADVKRKQKMYEEWRNRPDWWHDWTASNIWTAAFFVPLTKFDDPAVPTHDRFLRLVEKRDSQPQMAAAANALAEQLRFFHWRLEFPQVFDRGGFDVVLGNPPWERFSVSEEEHWADDQYISDAPKKAERVKRIEEYRRSSDPAKVRRVRQFYDAVRWADVQGKFIRENDRFALTAVGDMNSYAIFAEASRRLIRNTGRCGLLLPGGMVTDDTTKRFFGDLVRTGTLVSILGYENEGMIFPAVHHAFKFCALTISGSAIRKPAKLVFLCRRFEDAHDAAREVYLSSTDFSILNPNTSTCPVFRSRKDADLTLKLCKRVPALVNDNDPSGNSWGAYCIWLVHLGNHAEHVRLLWDQDDGNWSDGLYEPKLFHAYDHRYATFDGLDPKQVIAGQARLVTVTEKQSPSFAIAPRYFVKTELTRELFTKYPDYKRGWLLAWRDVARNVDERTCIATALPRGPASVSCPVLGTAPNRLTWLLLANLNALVLDFVARQKTSGIHLNFAILKQLPIIAADAYSPTDIEFVRERVTRLVYTGFDIKPFAEDLNYSGAPFEWKENDRALTRAELDAYYAHLYGLTRDELRYILDPKDVFGGDFPSETFRVLKEREIKEYGEYRTQRLVLQAFDKLADSPRFRDEIPKRKSAFDVPKRMGQTGM